MKEHGLIKYLATVLAIERILNDVNTVNDINNKISKISKTGKDNEINEEDIYIIVLDKLLDKAAENDKLNVNISSQEWKKFKKRITRAMSYLESCRSY